jgi:phytanoyl-CoA hydroxylase
MITLGDEVGTQIENDFTKKALESGLTEEQARNAFNQNMMSTGLLSEYPAEFAQKYNRRWLVSAYEAGDVVVHKPHAVYSPLLVLEFYVYLTNAADTCIDCEQ